MRTSGRVLAVTGYRDSLKPGVHAEGLQQVAYVVSYRLSAQMQLVGDLVGGEATLEHP